MLQSTAGCGGLVTRTVCCASRSLARRRREGAPPAINAMACATLTAHPCSPLPRRALRLARACADSGGHSASQGSATPLVDALRSVAGDGTIPFHVPGHAVRCTSARARIPGRRPRPPATIACPLSQPHAHTRTAPPTSRLTRASASYGSPQQRGAAASPSLLELVGREALRHDLTELSGLDMLSTATGCIREAQARERPRWGLNSEGGWFVSLFALAK